MADIPLDVRFGSKADIRLAPVDVRFTPKADMDECDLDVRFVAKSGLMHCNKPAPALSSTPTRRTRFSLIVWFVCQPILT
jgi:hypothetical protein